MLSRILPQALKQKTLERIVYIISHDFARSMLTVHNKISLFRTSMICWHKHLEYTPFKYLMHMDFLKS